MKYRAELTSNSIDKLVSKKELKDVLSEYIWNGFDALASKINIDFNYNELGAIESITIKDDGHGIIYDELSSTFRCVLDSKKIAGKRGSNIHGSKGKGRFSFIAIGELAIWETTYKNDNQNECYKITIDKKSSHEFEVTDKTSTNIPTGTKVTISGIRNINYDLSCKKKLEKDLIEEFAWFLYLNKSKDYSIILNNETLDYMRAIDDDLSIEKIVEINDNQFKINLIKWSGSFKEKYNKYFLNEKYNQVYKKTTSFNNKGLAFPHSVFVISKYFNDFYPLNDNKNNDQINILQEKNQRDKTFRELDQIIIDIIKSQIRFFTKEQAPKIIAKLEKEGAFPKFKESSRIDAIRKEDLTEVLIEICAVQPKIFTGSIENKKSIVGFLNLLLDTDEREGIINIMDSIVSLTPDERLELNDVLKKTTLSRILRTISSIQNRLKVIKALERLVYDETSFTNERDHIQKIIENNYWLFGEQYHLASADKNFERALEGYNYLLDGYKSEESYKIDHPEKNRRPDIFMCRSNSSYLENSTQLEENIIVELKAPHVALSMKIYRQIEDYMLFISKEPRFNSRLRKWKFIMVGLQVEDDIIDMYPEWEGKGNRFLINKRKNFEIYAMSWDDVFKNFELNNKYILEKLEFDEVLIKDEIDELKDENGRVLVDEITKEILSLKNKM